MLFILFLNTLTLLARTQSVDNLFHKKYIDRPLGKWNVVTSNLLCFFTSVKIFPLVILLSLIKIYITINICITFIWPPPLNIRVSSVVSPHSFNCSSYLRSLLLFTVLGQYFAAMIAAHAVAGDRSTVTGVIAPISTGHSLVYSTNTCARVGIRDSFWVFFAYKQNC